MAPLMLIPALALLLGPVSARAEDARRQANDTYFLAEDAVEAGDEASAREAAARPFDGGIAQDNTVVAPGVIRKTSHLYTPAPRSSQARREPPLDVAPKPSSSKKLTTKLALTGAGALGALQGWFAGGLVGAAAGLGMGLAAAWLFHKREYGAAFGVTAGAVIGTALGGPVGALVGAVVGGVIGHFLGKLFL